MSQIIQGKTQLFFSPNKIMFGLNTAGEVANEVKSLGGTKPLIVTDPGVVKANILAPVINSLESAGIPYVLFDGVEPEPPARLVDEGARKLHAEGCDMVIGIGGGSSLDVSKGVSVMATNEGGVLDVCGIDMVKNRGVPKILLPTTAGTGAEVTRVFVITDEQEKTKKVVYSPLCLSDVAIVDPNLTLTMPPKVTAETGIDALVHGIETYVAMSATAFSDILAERAIALIAKYLPMAWSKGSNLEARYNMSLAALICGMGFASGGLGAVHALAYPLGTEFHMPHGLSNAIMLPHVMKYNLCGNPARYAKIAELMGKDVYEIAEVEAAEMSVEAVRELLDTIHVSYRLRDYGIKKEDLPKFVEGGMKQARLFVPNPRDLSEEDVASIYEEAY